MLLYSFLYDVDKKINLTKNLCYEEIINLQENQCEIFLSQKDLFNYIKPFLSADQFDSMYYIFSIEIDKGEFDKQLNRDWVNKENRYIAFPKLILLSVCNQSSLKNKVQCRIEKIFNYNNILFSTSISIIHKLQTLGTEINEKYVDSICEYIDPFYIGELSNKIPLLFFYDLKNKIFFSDQGNKVVVYKEQPKIYDNFIDAFLANHDKQYDISLLSLHQKGISPQAKSTEEFTNFCVTIKKKSQDTEHLKIDCIRKITNHLFNWKKSNFLEEDFIKHQERCLIKKCNSLDDYILQCVKHRAFRFVYEYLSLYHDKSGTNNSKQTSFDLTFDEYSKNLQLLLQRYSKNNESVFEKVENLNDYDGYTGIYILCFDHEMKMYIGQTKQSFKKRITSHFIKPQSDFDYTHSFDEISSIYILHTTSEFINYVEADCIANIESKYILNKLAASESIELITSKSYNPKNYMLSNEGVISIVNDVEKAKKYNRQNIEWDNWIEEERRAFNKLKRIKDENKTEDLCILAVRYRGDAISYVPERLKTEKVCYEAFTHYPEPEAILKHIPQSIMSESFIKKIVKHNKKTIKLIPAELITPDIEKIAKVKKK